jgi:hypothetical protein
VVKRIERPDILKHDAGYYDGEQYVFSAEEIKDCIDWADQLEEEIEILKKEAEPFRAQIDQRKTYTVGRSNL